MIRLRCVPARSVTVSISFAAVVALSLAGCSSESGPNPKASLGSTAAPSASGASSGALRNESLAVLAWTPPAPVARTEGKVSDRFFPGGAGTVPSTAEVRASANSTILTWQLSSATDMRMAGYSLSVVGWVDYFPDGVRLVDPVGKKSYGVNTLVEHVKPSGKTYCVCSRLPSHVGPDPVRMTAAYPPLPATATSVSVRIPYFAPVTVPVTR
jgi:hypothetical protein